MSAVVTVTFNPSIDKSIIVAGLIPEKKLHCSAPVLEPGGGGINVARGIERLGTPVSAIFFSGGYHGRLLTELLTKEKINCIPIETSNLTRENWVITEESGNRQYRFVMPGTMIHESEWKLCLVQLDSIDGIKFIVVSGSMPEGFPSDIFQNLRLIASRKKAKLIVDSSGDGLVKAVQSGVFMIKPSINEFNLLRQTLQLTNHSLAAAAEEVILKKYCEVVVVSMGEAGALLVTKDMQLQVKAPSVKKMSTVGAGDSMVAGIVHSLINNKTIEDAVRFGVACGTAATKNAGTALFRPEDAYQLYKEMQGGLVNDSEEKIFLKI